MRYQRSFKAKLLVVQLLAVIPLLLFIFYIFDLWSDTTRSNILDNTIKQAKLVAFSIGNSFEKGLFASKSLANSSTFKSAMKNEPAVIEEELKSITAITLDISSINIADISGKILYDSTMLTSNEKNQISISDRDYFQKVLSSKQPIVSDPVTGRSSGLQVVIMSAPIMDKDKITAVVSSAYELAVIKNRLENVLPPSQEYMILIYDGNGRLIMILNKPLPTEEEKALFSNFSFLEKNKRNTINIIENQKLPNSDKVYLGSSVPVEGFGWTVVSLVSADELFAPLYKTQSITWLILLSALLFALSLISYVLRKIKMIY